MEPQREPKAPSERNDAPSVLAVSFVLALCALIAAPYFLETPLLVVVMALPGKSLLPEN